MSNSNDWREALTPLQKGKDYVFIDLPSSHHEYNTRFYPYNVFETAVEMEKIVELLPYGESYGIDSSTGI